MQKKLLYGRSGILLTKVAPTGPVGIILQKHDILTEIDGIPINNDATIHVDDQYRPCSKIEQLYEKVPYWHYIRLKHPGEVIRFTIIRDGQVLKKSCTIQVGYDELVPKIDFRISDEYCIVGGFVFLPLNVKHVFNKHEEKDFLKIQNKHHLISHTLNEYKQFDDHQIVILSEIIPSLVTIGYDMKYAQLISVNGEEIRNIKHLQSVLDNAIGNVEFEFNQGVIAIINIEKARDINKSMYTRLNIKK